MNQPKRAIITGITGQDGSYLAELLLKKGYKVYGIVRRSSTFNRWRLNNIYNSTYEHHPNLRLEYGDMNDSSSLIRIIKEIQPDEIYNLAAQSHVQISFETPEYTGDIDALGVLRIVEALRMLGLEKSTKLYQASTSELYGNALTESQDETTPFHPVSPYGVAKLYAYSIVDCYRQAYGLFAVNGILFNHESPRRGENFVSKKIVRALTRVKYGLDPTLKLGNLEARRDWGYAKEFVEAMWMMLQQQKPDDFVIATGEVHSVRDFVEETARCLDIDLQWTTNGTREVGIDKGTEKIIVEHDDSYQRPVDINILKGNITKAKEILGWEPKIKFRDLVRLMVDYEIKLIESNEQTTLIDQ